VAIAAAVVALATSLAVTLVVLNAGGSAGAAAPPPTHANTLVRIDPRTNARDRVIDVGLDPAALAAWGNRLWVYSSGVYLVTEVDARTTHVLHTTTVPPTPLPDLGQVAGPVLAADAYGAWLVSIDAQGRSSLTLVLPGGGRRSYLLPGRAEAVATGPRAVWVIDRGPREDQLLRLNPATGKITVQARLPASARVDSLTVGYGYVWLVSSSTATLYRINPRSGAIDHVDLRQADAEFTGTPTATLTAGRPGAVFGDVWVGLSKNGGDTVRINAGTLRMDEDFGCCTGDNVNGSGVEAFGSLWGYDVAGGEVQRWNPPNLAHLTQVTDPPYYWGNCLTSIAAAGGAVWVTLAASEQDRDGNATCYL
jgi:hypothetical protein